MWRVGIKKEPETRYRFVKDYVYGGITIKKGVAIKPPYKIEDGFMIRADSSVFGKISMEYFESFEVEKFSIVKKSDKK